MNPRLSAHLDLLRVLAALVVLFSHFAYARFSRGDYLFVREWNLGSDAVVVFFVLSGYVVAHTAARPGMTFGRFAFARLTRLYSVVIPALILTIVFDRIGVAIDPAVYDGWWWNPAPFLEVLARGLTFSTEWSGSGFRPGTNGPFWSISYEAAYYALFGIWIFMRGWPRTLLFVAALALFGLKPLALAPAWLLGVWLRRREDLIVGDRAALALALLPLAIYAAAVDIGLPPLLMAVTQVSIGPEATAALRFSDEFLWNALLGALVVVHLIGVRSLGAVRPDRKPGWGRPATWLAGATFSIYLVHYPALQLLDALLPQDAAPILRDAGLLLGALGVSLIFAQAFERTLPRLRRSLEGWGAAEPLKRRPAQPKDRAKVERSLTD